MADEQAGADDQTKVDQSTEGDTSTDDTTNDGTTEAGDDSSNTDTTTDTDTTSDDDAPPVRKSAKDFIIERKDRKIAKLTNDSGDDTSDTSDKETPDIRKIIQEELAPIKQTFAKSKDEEELQATLTKYPDAKKIEKKVRQYMENEAYSRVPVEFIVRGLLGAREAAKTKADEEAKGTRQGGHTRRPAEVKQKTAWDMTEEEFNKSVSNLMSGKTQ